MKLLKVHDNVMIESPEGFGGPGHVVEIRNIPQSHYKVRLNDGSQPDFWAYDGEIVDPKPEPQRVDSRPETYKHIQTVQKFIGKVIVDLLRRQQDHDQSKLVSPEVETFDEFTMKLAGSTYGSEEYKGYLAAMKLALDHHYAANSHHPEHYRDGIRGMSLLDLLEMICDWKAATTRHVDGDILKSIEMDQKRFGYSDELKQILLNTLQVLQ